MQGLGFQGVRVEGVGFRVFFTIGVRAWLFKRPRKRASGLKAPQIPKKHDMLAGCYN